MQARTRMHSFYLLINPGTGYLVDPQLGGNYIQYKFGDTNDLKARKAHYRGANPRALFYDLSFLGAVDGTEHYVTGNPGKTFEHALAEGGIQKEPGTEWYVLAQAQGDRLREIAHLIHSIAYNDQNIVAAAHAVLDYIIGKDAAMTTLEQIYNASPLDALA